MAGPDAAADQGPAIKAVWEPQPQDLSPEPGARRRDRRPTTRAGQPGAAGPRATGRKKRTLMVGGAAAVAVVAVGVIGVAGLDGGDSLIKGAATRVLPAASPTDATAAQSANSTIGSSLSITGSRSPSASPSRSASPSATRSETPTAAASPTASRTASASPSAQPSPHKTTCFLIFCG